MNMKKVEVLVAQVSSGILNNIFIFFMLYKVFLAGKMGGGSLVVPDLLIAPPEKIPTIDFCTKFSTAQS